MADAQALALSRRLARHGRTRAFVAALAAAGCAAPSNPGTSNFADAGDAGDAKSDLAAEGADAAADSGDATVAADAVADADVTTPKADADASAPDSAPDSADVVDTQTIADVAVKDTIADVAVDAQPDSAGDGGDVAGADVNPCAAACGPGCEGAACDDGNPCSTADTCTNGVCAGAALDADGDGFGPGAACGGDCDDGNAAIHPGATESCDDTVDNNCDGQTDEGCSTCAKPGFAAPACSACLDGFISIATNAGDVCAPDQPIWGWRDFQTQAYFTDNGDGTVSDNQTQLMWQKKDSGAALAWSAASGYCLGLTLAGQNDWRLPTAAELQTTIDFTQHGPAVAKAFGQSKTVIEYWSAVLVVGNPDSAWAMDTLWGQNNMLAGATGAFNGIRARCVR